MTQKMREQRGSYGSRLHQADDGTWVAYARWPDAGARERCQGADPGAPSSMREAIAESFPEIRCHVIDGLLAEPPADPPAQPLARGRSGARKNVCCATTIPRARRSDLMTETHGQFSWRTCVLFHRLCSAYACFAPPESVTKS
jgi:hypothetical protein